MDDGHRLAEENTQEDKGGEWRRRKRFRRVRRLPDTRELTEGPPCGPLSF